MILLRTAGLALALVAGTIPAEAKLMLFGGTGHDEYLGCLDCSEYATDSICNEFGSHGSEFASDSIFNEFGTYGSEFSSKSPWNAFTSSKDVPVLVDEDGGFYGYFTINQFRSDAVGFAADLYTLYDRVDGELELVQKLLCGAF